MTRPRLPLHVYVTAIMVWSVVMATGLHVFDPPILLRAGINLTLTVFCVAWLTSPPVAVRYHEWRHRKALADLRVEIRDGHVCASVLLPGDSLVVTYEDGRPLARVVDYFGDTRATSKETL